ncbi:MAG TPA: hypothetical protein H9673_02100 [Candidatus Adamsella sp.]|nr:hypothetical protein [Candidatus Adamsella sp.]
MDFNKILENKPLVAAVIGGAVAIALLLSIIALFKPAAAPTPGGGKVSYEANKVIKEELELLTTDNIGKAIELQALLAREGIQAKRRAEGQKSTLYLEKYTQSERDRALLAIVKSGIMDEHMGLEIFDKGDFTSTKQDKKIRLARAINGELSRLIRKIPPIENASVFIAIPDSSLFTSKQSPITATVQVSIPSGTTLERDKVRAIKNLLMGSIPNLRIENISITDTNGTVYKSIESAEDNSITMTEENDQYMKSKVQAQLDKLIGPDKYVVTVSTFLRQVPVERSSVTYDPQNTAVATEQRFSEQLGDQSKDSSKLNQAASVYLPAGLPQGASSATNRNYGREAKELQYNVSQTQTTEYQKPGIIEDISIAVTIDQNALPASISTSELKGLIARAASPKVNPDNVTVVFSEDISPFLASEKPVQLPKPESSGNPWWTVAALLCIGLLAGLFFIMKRAKYEAQKHQKEIEALKKFNEEQSRQIQNFNNTTNQLLAQQTELKKALLEETQKINQNQQKSIPKLDTSIDEVAQKTSEYDEEEVGEYLKSWIESAS